MNDKSCPYFQSLILTYDRNLIKGQRRSGVVTAGELLTKAVIAEGKYAQSIPFFGGERRGAPVSSEVRVSDKPIPLHRRVYNPDVVTVFDTTLLEILNPWRASRKMEFSS